MCYSGVFERVVEKYGQLYGAMAEQEIWDLFEMRREKNPKAFRYEARTYPHYYAPVIHATQSKLVVEPMRYGIYLKQSIHSKKRLTDYNARRDNITAPFWSDAFRVNHGFVILREFFESVVVADLIRGGLISLDDAKRIFAADKAARRKKVLEAGKKYQETETELKDPLLKNIEIAFKPKENIDLIVPVIFSSMAMPDGELDHGFAIITDPATPEVAEAGHDRRPIMLDKVGIHEWLHHEKKSPKQLDEVLKSGPRILLEYRLSKQS